MNLKDRRHLFIFCYNYFIEFLFLYVALVITRITDSQILCWRKWFVINVLIRPGKNASQITLGLVKKTKTKQLQLDLQVFSRVGKTVKKLNWTLNNIMNNQCICNILIKFTYLMVWKLLYLLMDWKTFNKLSYIEQVKGVIRALQTSIMVLSIFDTHNGTSR